MSKATTRAPGGRPRLAATLLALLVCSGCTQRLYEGAALPRRDVARLDATGSLLWSIDGQRMYVHPLGYIRYELSPGAHSLVVKYQTPEEPAAIRRPERQVSPYECSMALIVDAGVDYTLYTHAIGLDTRHKRWDGRWEAWVSRDDGDGEAIARCVAGADDATAAGSPRAGTPTASATPLPAPTALRRDTVSAAGAVPPSAASVEPAAAAAPPVAIPRPIAPAQIRLGTWNLRGLGRGGERDVVGIAAIIEATFDVVALTEVVARADTLSESALATALGDGWRWLADPSDPHTPRERYVFAYRRSALRPCPGWEQARPYATEENHSFARPPVFVCLQTPPGDESVNADFLLAAYRADWGDGDLTAVAAEVGGLDAVFAAMREAMPGEGDLFIAGDFNLGPDDVRPLVAAAPVVRGDGSTLDLRGERSELLADQILVLDPKASREMRGMGEVVDVRAAHGGARSFARTISDHLPVVLRLETRLPDDD